MLGEVAAGGTGSVAAALPGEVVQEAIESLTRIWHGDRSGPFRDSFLNPFHLRR